MPTWLPGESFIEWMEQRRGRAAQSSDVLGVHRMSQWPRIHASRERWRSSISLALRLRVCLSALLLSLFTIHLRSHDFTHGTWRRAKAAAPRAFAKIRVLFLLAWDHVWPNPPYATSTAADGVCLVQSGGGPFVYRSMGWNDRAKLLERAQL